MITMKFYEVSPVGIVGKDFDVLTYSWPEAIRPGRVVEIEVGSRLFVGVVIATVDEPSFKVKPISRLLFNRPLPSQLLRLHQWLAGFYDTHPGTVWQTMLPSGLHKNHRNIVVKKSTHQFNRDDERTNFVLNKAQLSAIEQLVEMKSGTALLHGITGSGKTEIYKAMALEAAGRGLSSIIMVPEIALTAQLVREFERDFENVIVTHSSMTPSQRFSIWKNLLENDQPTVIIGPRSALFMPVQKLGLIVVDECHEPSYKQDKAPRYNTLRAAAALSNFHEARLILGSATPAIADYYLAQKLGRPIITINQLARQNAAKPSVSIVDITKRHNLSSRSSLFSKQLITAIEKTIEAGQQVLLFHNRRGSASVTLCINCGWLATCPNCTLPLTLHSDSYQLRCHLCGYHTKPPTSCPECHNSDIIHRGIGTKRIEEEVRRLFPSVNIKRFDGDTERGQAVQDIFEELHTGKIDVIIGTQAIAKGLDLPNLRLVGIVQADAGLALPDFSSSERTFQLVAQASGRVGRGADATSVIIQTFQPDHPAVVFGAAQDYEGFFNSEIQERARGHFPPFSYLLKLTCTYKTEKGAANAAMKLAREIANQHKDVKILGPAPAFYEHIRGTYRWQIVIRATNRASLVAIAEQVPPTKWQMELDPISLL